MTAYCLFELEFARIRHLSPCGRGRIALPDAIRVRGYGLSRDLDPSPQPSPTAGEGAHHAWRQIGRCVDKNVLTREATLAMTAVVPMNKAKTAAETSPERNDELLVNLATPD